MKNNKISKILGRRISMLTGFPMSTVMNILSAQQAAVVQLLLENSMISTGIAHVALTGRLHKKDKTKLQIKAAPNRSIVELMSPEYLSREHIDMLERRMLEAESMEGLPYGPVHEDSN